MLRRVAAVWSGSMARRAPPACEPSAAAAVPPRGGVRMLSSGLGSVASLGLALLKPLGLGYLVLCGAVFALQRQLQYFPNPSSPPLPDSTVYAGFAGIEEVELRAADGTRLHAWLWEAGGEGKRLPFFWLRGRIATHRDATAETDYLLEGERGEETEAYTARRLHRRLGASGGEECETEARERACSSVAIGDHSALPHLLPPRSYTEAELRAACAVLRARYPSLASIDVLMLHGNAGDRSNRLGWMHLLHDGLGLSVFVLDYRGYGGSSGSPTEKGLIEDGRAAARWIRDRRRAEGKRGRRLVLWGESIGSGVAIALAAEGESSCTATARLGGGQCLIASKGTGAEDLAVEQEQERNAASGGSPSAIARTARVHEGGDDGLRADWERPDAVMLEGGLDSCLEIAAQAYPFLPVRLPFMMRDRFDNVARAQAMSRTLPVLQIHGLRDAIVPLERGRRLFEALPAERKRLVVLPGAGHNDIPYHDPERYLSEIAAFLGEQLD